MSSIMKGIVDEGEEVAVIYIDGEETAKYSNKHEAVKDAEFLRIRHPDKRIEIKTEVRGGKGGNEKIGETEAIKGADGKRCWKGKRYAGTENGKDKCIPVKNEAANPAQQAAIAINMKKQHKKPKNEGILDKFKKPAKKDSMRERLSQMSIDELHQELKNYAPRVSGAIASGSLVGGAVSDYVNAIKAELDKRAFKDFTEKYPDWDKGLREGVIVGHDKDDPEVAILGGGGTMSLNRLKQKALGEARQLADDVAMGKFGSSAYNVKQLANTLATIAAAEEEMKKLYFGESEEWTDYSDSEERNQLDDIYGEDLPKPGDSVTIDGKHGIVQRETAQDYYGGPAEFAVKYDDGRVLKHSVDTIINGDSSYDEDMHEDTDMRFAAEKTPETNPYGGLKDHQTRGAINEMPDTSGPVGTQPGGWRRTDIEEEWTHGYGKGDTSHWTGQVNTGDYVYDGRVIGKYQGFEHPRTMHQSHMKVKYLPSGRVKQFRQSRTGFIQAEQWLLNQYKHEIDKNDLFNEEELDEKCWNGYKQLGKKLKGGKLVPDCVKAEESSIMKGLSGRR